MRARKENEYGTLSGVPRSFWLAAVDLLLQRAMSSERQRAEWEVWALKGPFSRLTATVYANSESRMRIIAMSAHLFN